MEFDLIEDRNKQYDILVTRKSRQLIKAEITAELSKTANKIITLIIVLLKQNNNSKLLLPIYMSQIETYLMSHGGKTRENILSALEELCNAYIKGTSRNGSQSTARYLQSYTYDSTNGLIVLDIDPVAPNVIFETAEGYAKGNWIYTFAMSSKYGQKLYELVILENFRKDKIIQLPLEELKKMLGILNKYPNLAHFKKYVLNKAIEDVNTCTPFKLTYKTSSSMVIFYIDIRCREEVDTLNDSLLNNKEISKLLDSVADMVSSTQNSTMTKDDFAKAKHAIFESANQLTSGFLNKQARQLDSREQLSLFDFQKEDL